MFFVFSKDKIISCIVSFSTVAILLGLAFFIRGRNDLLSVSSSEKLVPIYNVKTSEKKVALTINCAWNADDIDSILNTLDKTGTKVTFFVVGDWVRKYPEAVKKISEKGHEIGNHSNTHPHVKNLTLEENKDEIYKCSKEINQLISNDVNLYRAPYGEYNDIVLKSAEECAHKTIQWDLDTLDYNGLTGEEMWKRLDGKLKSGSIILCHNGTKHTADSLEYIINNIKNAGYEIVPVGELTYDSDYYIDITGTQIKK